MSNAYIPVSEYNFHDTFVKASKYFPTFDSAQCNIFLARHSFSFSIHDVLQFWDLTKFMQDLRPPKKGSLLGTSMGAQKLSKSVPAVELDWRKSRVDITVAIIKIAIIDVAIILITVITVLIIITLGLITCNNQCHCQLHSWEWVSEWCRGRRTGQSSSPAGCSFGPGCPDLWLESI